MSVQKLKSLNCDNLLEMEELVALSAFARGLEMEYVELGQEAPEWLERSATTLREEIARRTKAADLKTLRDIETQLEGLKTQAEKRGDLQKQLAELQGRLGMAAPARKR